ncbi:MAG: tetratricopeptide repeat protein, partial [Gammaproteobacteria bacterium]
YERSIAIDPSYAEPYARLARVHTYPWITGLRTSREESLDTALKLARRAMELDAQLPLAQGMLSWVCTWSGRHDEAMSAARQAVALDPGGAEVYYWLRVSLSFSGINDEADRALAQAMRFNPHPPVYYLWARAQNYAFTGHYDEAIDLGKQVLRTTPTFSGGYTVLAASYALAGRIDEARQIGAELKRLFPHYCRLDERREGLALDASLRDRFYNALTLAGI